MSIFHHTIGFTQPDPLGDGLGDEIAAEQKEPEAFTNLDDTPGDVLSEQWSAIVKDIEKDPDWFTFSED